MNKKSALLGAALLAVLAPIAFAQPAATGSKQAPKAGAAAPKAATGAAPAVGPSGRVVKQGPTIQGVCILSDAAVVGGSKVGQYANQKIQQLQTNVNAELNATNNQLSAERSNLQAQVAATSQTAQAAAIDAFQQKVATFQTTLEERSDQLDRTKENTYARILTLTEPFLQDIYEARNCSLLLDATGVLFANETMNITPDVIAELDRRATEITVELAPTRAQLQAQQGSAQPAGATPPPAGGVPARGPVGPRP